MITFCTCPEFTARGCWEHAMRAPEDTMAWRLGISDAKKRVAFTEAELPFSGWTEGEKEHYRAAVAFVTGRRAVA